MEESKREDIEAEDPAGTKPEEPFPELTEMVREAITKELTSPEFAEDAEEESAESPPDPAIDDPAADEAPAITTTDGKSGDPATDDGSQESADAGIDDDSDPELNELREILLGDSAQGSGGSRFPGLITSVRKELRGAFEKQTEVLRTHSRDTRALLEELLSHVRAIAETLNALESDQAE